jgi:hypothetical protein
MVSALSCNDVAGNNGKFERIHYLPCSIHNEFDYSLHKPKDVLNSIEMNEWGLLRTMKRSNAIGRNDDDDNSVVDGFVD